MRSSCNVRMLAIGLLLFATRVSAQPLSPTINPAAAPIQVTQAQEKAAVRPAVESRTLVNIAFGATALGGNTRTYAGNLGGRFGLNRRRTQLMVEALGTLGGSRTGRLGNVEWTSRNVIARARYDLFLSQDDAVFAAMAPRRDVFAGIEIRLQNQIGYSRNVYATGDTHRLWTELGYDLTWDYLTKDVTTTDDITAIVREADPALVPEGTTSIIRTIRTREALEDPRQVVHSARLFLGYTNRLFTAANLSLGVETLFDFRDKDNVRVNGLVEFTSSVTQSFKLGVQSRLLYDAEPVPGKKEADVVATVQLVYTFDSVVTTSSAPCPACPACDCSAQVEAAKKACPEACVEPAAKDVPDAARPVVPTKPAATP